jgi:hypothetical protein
MPSASLHVWTTARAATLDEIEAAHRSVGGHGPGRRTATQQINYAYAVLLSAQFQGFCRNLYSECVDFAVAAIVPVAFQEPLQEEFIYNRKLQRGNPNPGNIGEDFNRLGLAFWDAVAAMDLKSATRRRQLEDLNLWRNAIAHQDFDSTALGGAALPLDRVRAWRAACHGLALTFDDVMRVYLQHLTGTAPW